MALWRWICNHWIVSVGLAVVVLLAVAAAATWYFMLRSPGTSVDLAQALRQFRAQEAVDDPTSGALPAPGVYRYTGSGGENVSLPGVGRTFPSTSFIIVTDRGRCTTMDWRPFVEHMEGVQVCLGRQGSLMLTSAPSYEQIAGVQTTSVMRCGATAYFVPPRPSAGTRWRAICRAPGDRVVMRGQVLGSGVVRVGGRAVPSWHIRLVFGLSGAQSGSNPTEYWIAATDGLILRQAETVKVSQGAGPLGSITYNEDMHIALASLAPTTGRA
jgi:hypothetical protein